MSLKVMLDIDDVVTETTSTLLNLFNRIYGHRIPFSDMTEWGFNILPDIETSEDSRNLVKTFTHSGGFSKTPLVPGALEGVRKLQKQGDDIYFVTARNSQGISDTYRFFAAYDLPINQVFFDRDKGWQARHHNIDVVVDDGLHNLSSVRQQHPSATRILYNRPWNRNCGGQEHLFHYRVANWEQLDRVLSGVRRGRWLQDRKVSPEELWRMPEVYRDD